MMMRLMAAACMVARCCCDDTAVAETILMNEHAEQDHDTSSSSEAACLVDPHRPCVISDTCSSLGRVLLQTNTHRLKAQAHHISSADTKASLQLHSERQSASMMGPLLLKVRTSFLQMYALQQCSLTSWLGSLLPVVLLSAILLGWGSGRFSPKAKNPAEEAVLAMLPVVFFLSAIATVMVPDSYKLVQALGKSATMSGMMVGQAAVGGMLGALAMFLCLQKWPKLWGEHPRPVFGVTLLCTFTGALVYIYVAAICSSSSSPSPSWLWSFLLVGRFVGGMGSAACFTFICASTMQLTTLIDRPDVSLRLFLANLMGMGTGPLMAAVVEALDPCGGFVPVGIAQVVMACTALFLVGLYYPTQVERPNIVIDEASCQLFRETTKNRLLERQITISLAVDHMRTERISVISGAFLITTIRAFVISGLEVAVALVLEKEDHWSREMVGVSLGAGFLFCIAVMLLHNGCREFLSTSHWIILYNLTGALASLLVSKRACNALAYVGVHSCGGLLLVSSSLLYPMIFMGDILCLGLMQQHLFPTGSWLDVSHALLWQEILCCVGKWLGPWVARWLCDRGMQDIYALSLCVCSLASLFIFVIAVRPSLVDVEATDSKMN
eukprot:gnl/TRDRNA2_/TRDRNA2_188425_c0_seq1.p1 gnl/TRDRNA2_/TRDRNA2_188425_c0~~gnl/TRDRNA2_/TRDRNA2_188425_c0_seq1.p1  ORF type:complete len:611 (-),score=75.64 gnl/TRDRNA2_/TRDRNA2_188425_c0_seq1:182-2014(-)